MTGMKMLLSHARARGDGLLPELEELLAKLPAAADYLNVIDFAAVRGAPQPAGPNPVGTLPETLPDNVVMFRRSVVSDQPIQSRKAARAPRISRAPRLMNRKD